MLRVILVLIFATVLTTPQAKAAPWQNLKLEDKVLAYLQKTDANFSDAQEVLKAFVKDPREYSAKTSQVVKVIEDYSAAHPEDAAVKEKARRLGNQAIERFEEEKNRIVVGRVETGMRLLTAGAGGLVGLAMTLVPFVISGAPEIVWVPPAMMLAGWFSAPAVVDQIVKRIPVLKSAISFDDAETVVKTMTDFLGQSSVCKDVLTR